MASDAAMKRMSNAVDGSDSGATISLAEMRRKIQARLDELEEHDVKVRGERG